MGLKGFRGYLEMAPDGATKDNIQDIKGLTGRHSVERKSGSTAARILIQLIYASPQMPEIQIKLTE